MVPGGTTMLAFKGEKKPPVLPGHDAYEPQEQPPWHNNPKDTIAEFISWQ